MNFTPKLLLIGLALSVGLMTFKAPAADASVVIYNGHGAAAGFSARADFQLLNGGSLLHIDLVNTSTNPMPGWEQVLNSVNFKLPTAIIGGNADLAGSEVCVDDGAGNWTSSGFSGNLNSQYSFSNIGVNNHKSDSAIMSNVDLDLVAELKNSVTSLTHFKLNRFDGAKERSRGGIDFGLVNGNQAFGQAEFVQSRLSFDLQLAAPLANLDFLSRGSYAEFGNSYAFVGGTMVPEPGSMMVWGVILGGCLMTRRRTAA
jgi:hypothetical protein